MRLKKVMIVCVAAAAALGANAELTHRFLNGSVPGATVDSTYTEAPEFVSDIPAGTIANAPNQSMDVGMDYPNKKSGSALGDLLSSSAGSVSVWVKADALPGEIFFMNTAGFKLMYSGPNLKAVYNGWTELALTPAAAGDWYHVALTWDDSTSTMTFYVNGSLIGSANDAVLSPMSTWGITVGGLNLADDDVQLANQFDGKLYDLQFYDHTLDSTEVSDLYANPGSPELPISKAALVNRYLFDGNGDDAVGAVPGTLTAAGTHIEAPLFTNDIPVGAAASAPAQSMMVGMDYGNKKSGMDLNNTVLNSITNAGSMSLWLKPHTAVAGQYNLILPGGLTVLLEGPEIVSVYHTPPESAQTRVGYNGGVTAGGWHHVAVTWDAAEAETLIYVNGVPAIQEYDGVPGVGGDFSIRVGGYEMGDSPDFMAAQFDGQLYDLQFYNNMLSSDEVFSLYENPGSVPDAGATANGVPYLWLSFYYPTLETAADYENAAASDTDGDGLSAETEYFVNSDPTDGASVFSFTANEVNAGAGAYIVTWGSQEGSFFTLSSNINLTADSWGTVESGIEGQAAETSYTTTVSAAEAFFKVELD